ncbi:MAG TPA: helix-turn-helix domain-containing protein [Anaerolineae bacterium]
MPTTAIPDVAKLAVVSISTVSRMYNGRNRVHPRTRPRVQKAIRQLDYEQIAPAHTLVEHLLSGHDCRRFAGIAGSNDRRDNAERLRALAVCAFPNISLSGRSTILRLRLPERERWQAFSLVKAL